MQRELVTRAMAGDHEAFTSLVDASVGRLYPVANMILRDQDRAQDAVQEALVSAWRDLRSLRDTGAWDAWLYRLTVWACYRQARKDRRRSLVESLVVPDGGTDQSSHVAFPIVERDRLERQLGRLPIKQPPGTASSAGRARATCRARSAPGERGCSAVRSRSRGTNPDRRPW